MSSIVKFFVKKFPNGIALSLVLSIFLLGCALSWLIVCGLLKLLCICFRADFDWLIATGIWVCMFLFNIARGTIQKLICNKD